MTQANIIPTAETDGQVYCTGVPLTVTEADLGDNLKSPKPIPVVYGHVIVAVVKVSINGILSGNNTYVFLQTDLGDGQWVDVAWCQYASAQVPQTFVLCGGGLGAMNNAFGANRNAGAAPSPQGSGSNVVPLGGRVRFTGFSSPSSGGSSSLAGQTTSVSATITYKILAPR